MPQAQPALFPSVAGLFFGLTQYTELGTNAQEEVDRFYKCKR